MTEILAKVHEGDYEALIRRWGVVETNDALKKISNLSGDTAREVVRILDFETTKKLHISVINNMDGHTARKSLVRDYLLDMGPESVDDGIRKASEILNG